MYCPNGLKNMTKYGIIKLTKSGTGSNEMLVITGVENVINENLHLNINLSATQLKQSKKE